MTNASRTLMMDLDTLDWDEDLVAAMGIPASMLPEIVPSIGRMGVGTGTIAGVPLCVVVGMAGAARDFDLRYDEISQQHCSFGHAAKTGERVDVDDKQAV